MSEMASASPTGPHAPGAAGAEPGGRGATGPERGSARQPERGSTRLPERGPTGQPERGPTREPERGPTRQPERGSTRERILDVALELFNEQGYDGTSLREIAQRLGITKAALYYHFERKEDILLELHLRLHALGRDILAQVDGLAGEEVVAAWPALLDGFIADVMANRQLFLMHQRNQTAFAKIADNERHQAENEDIEQRFRRLLSDPSIPLADRVRMSCSVGAVFFALMGAIAVFGDADAEEVADDVRGVVRDMFPRPGRGRARSSSKPDMR